MMDKRVSDSVPFVWSNPLHLCAPGTISEQKEDPLSVHMGSKGNLLTFRQTVGNVFKLFLKAQSLVQTNLDLLRKVLASGKYCYKLCNNHKTLINLPMQKID